MCDTSGLTYDLTVTAGFYSLMCGVLAGFAFLALTLVVSGSHRRDKGIWKAIHRETDARLLLSLGTAFLGLVVAAFQYANLAGERGCALLEGRAASEEFLGGVAFVFSTLLLFYAVVQLVTQSDAPYIGDHLRALVAILAPPLAILLLALDAVDVASTPFRSAGAGQLRPEQTLFTRQIELVAVWLPIGLLGLCLLCVILGWRRRRGGLGHDRTWRGTIRFAHPYVFLAFALAAVARSTMLPEAQPWARIGAPEVVFWLASCSAAVLLQSVLLCFKVHTVPAANSLGTADE